MIDRDRTSHQAALPMDGGAAGSGLGSGPSTSGASGAFQRSVQMNLELNAQSRKN